MNCVANGKLLKEKIFENIWIQPASGDAGSALGAALVGSYIHNLEKRTVDKEDSMQGTYLGPQFSNKEIVKYLNNLGANYFTLKESEIFDYLAKEIDDGKVIGWFNGKMEFGPRALGARSIIGDPRNQNMQYYES